MSDVKWIKIVTDIFDDEKILLIESMPEADSIIVIWFKLLCLAGRQNNNGVFMMGRIAYTDEMFATIFRRPLNTVRMALKVFEQYGMIEIVNDTVTIPNWGKHQKLDALEAKTAYMRRYMRDYRARQKALTDGETHGKTNSESKVSPPDKNKNKSKKEIREEYIVEEEEDARAREGDEMTCDELCAYAANNLQAMSPDAMEELLSYRDCMTDDLIRYAVNEACANGAPRWAYVRSILRKWQQQGHKTVGDVKSTRGGTTNGVNRGSAGEVPRRLFAGEIVV